jgi:uncharacterized protein
MGRLLMLLLIVAGLAWWVFSRVGRLRGGAGAPASGSGARKPAEATQQEMVACDHCGVHLPRGEALLVGDRAYCGEPHRQLGPRHP